jgi:hypothetical protein
MAQTMTPGQDERADVLRGTRSISFDLSLPEGWWGTATGPDALPGLEDLLELGATLVPDLAYLRGSGAEALRVLRQRYPAEGVLFVACHEHPGEDGRPVRAALKVIVDRLGLSNHPVDVAGCLASGPTDTHRVDEREVTLVQLGDEAAVRWAGLHELSDGGVELSHQFLLSLPGSSDQLLRLDFTTTDLGDPPGFGPVFDRVADTFAFTEG